MVLFVGRYRQTERVISLSSAKANGTMQKHIAAIAAAITTILFLPMEPSFFCKTY